MANAASQDEYQRTGVVLPKPAMEIIRQAAVYRAECDNTRVSVSATIADLILANRDLLERRP